MSGMDCCCRFLKIVVVIINCFISMVGIGVIVVGAYGLSITNKIPETGWNILFVSFVIILSLGVLMAVVGFLGCCGAATENQCLLGTFSAFMLMAVILNVTAAFLMSYYKEDISMEIQNGTMKLFESPDALIQHYDQINLIQQAFQCCGWTSYNDWLPSRFTHGTPPVFPKSCCVVATNCTAPNSVDSTRHKPANFNYHQSCKLATEKTVQFIIDNSPIILGVIGIFECLSFIASLALCCAIRKAEL